MKRVTFNVDEKLLKKAEVEAKKENKTLNSLFCELLDDYVERKEAAKNFHKLMKDLSYANSGGKFSRDEMNGRR